MSLDVKDCTADLDGVSPKQLETLGEWVAKFEKKYKVVGQVRFAYAARHFCYTNMSPNLG